MGEESRPFAAFLSQRLERQDGDGLRQHHGETPGAGVFTAPFLREGAAQHEETPPAGFESSPGERKMTTVHPHGPERRKQTGLGRMPSCLRLIRDACAGSKL